MKLKKVSGGLFVAAVSLMTFINVNVASANEIGEGQGLVDEGDHWCRNTADCDSANDLNYGTYHSFWESRNTCCGVATVEKGKKKQ